MARTVAGWMLPIYLASPVTEYKFGFHVSRPGCRVSIADLIEDDICIQSVFGVKGMIPNSRKE